MARYAHLQLLRLPERFERRKTGGGSPPPARDPVAHSNRLREQLNQAVEVQQRRRRPEFVDPSLILRVRMTSALLEDDWFQLGLTLLSSDEDRTLVLFSSSDDLTQFRERLAAYERGAPPGQKNPSYAAFIGGIESMDSIDPRDRIGVRAREDGFTRPEDFQSGTTYTVDVELWDIGRRDLRIRKLDEIAEYVATRAGDELDCYVGPSITMLRLRCDGAVIPALLGVEVIADLDFPPVPDVSMGEVIDLGSGPVNSLA